MGFSADHLFFSALDSLSQHCNASFFHVSYIVSWNIFNIVFAPGDPGALMLRPAAVGQNLFFFIFVDQSLHQAEIRTVIFEYLYVPLPDCWPWERPVQSTSNCDLYHFSIICSGVHRPCISFLTVDTPSVALSAASDSDWTDLDFHSNYFLWGTSTWTIVTGIGSSLHSLLLRNRVLQNQYPCIVLALQWVYNNRSKKEVKLCHRSADQHLWQRRCPQLLRQIASWILMYRCSCTHQILRLAHVRTQNLSSFQLHVEDHPHQHWLSRPPFLQNWLHDGWYWSTALVPYPTFGGTIISQHSLMFIAGDCWTNLPHQRFSSISTRCSAFTAFCWSLHGLGRTLDDTTCQICCRWPMRAKIRSGALEQPRLSRHCVGLRSCYQSQRGRCCMILLLIHFSIQAIMNAVNQFPWVFSWYPNGNVESWWRSFLYRNKFCLVGFSAYCGAASDSLMGNMFHYNPFHGALQLCGDHVTGQRLHVQANPGPYALDILWSRAHNAISDADFWLPMTKDDIFAYPRVPMPCSQALHWLRHFCSLSWKHSVIPISANPGDSAMHSLKTTTLSTGSTRSKFRDSIATGLPENHSRTISVIGTGSKGVS